jgi:hypothetical protein
VATIASGRDHSFSDREPPQTQRRSRALDAEERKRIEQECRDLVIAVAQLGDHRQAEEAAALFSEDCTWIRGGRPYRGREGIIESYARISPTQVTRHMSANSLVTVRDDERAEGVTYYMALHHDPGMDTPELPLPLDPPFSMGEWHDRFVRTPEGWRIAHRETKRLFERRGGH